MPAKLRSNATSDTLYIQRIGGRWYARIPVPNKHRAALGPYIRRALDTSDLHEARQRRWDVLAMARAQIAAHEAKGKPAGVTDVKLSYEAFRAKLMEEVGPPVVVNVLTG